jgi:hypothetical protein
MRVPLGWGLTRKSLRSLDSGRLVEIAHRDCPLRRKKTGLGGEGDRGREGRSSSNRYVSTCPWQLSRRRRLRNDYANIPIKSS